MADANQIKQGHPKGLYLLFTVEMWERFSYYGMRALFILYLTKALLFDKAYSASIYGSYTGLAYLTPLIGGYIADRYWGNRRSITVGAIVMALGQLMMFLSGCFFEQVSLATFLMITGLALLIIGNGFFKPNISTMVGHLYSDEDKRKDSAYTIFYMGINLGALISPVLCGILGDTGHPADFKWGFLLACIGMIFSLIIFTLFKEKYLVAPDGTAIGCKPSNKDSFVEDVQKEKQSVSGKLVALWGFVAVALFVLFFFTVSEGDIIGAFIFSLAIAVPGFIICDPNLTKVERDRIWVIYIVSFFVIFFWSAFEQAGVSLTYFAEEQTDRSLFSWTIPASAFQSVNAVAVVVFAPIFAFIWSKLRSRNLEPSSPYKLALGLFFLAIGYLVIAFGVKGLAPGIKVSMMWLCGLYVINTFGELCLSPIGLSLVNKLAPIKFASLLMGVWFLSTATANKFAGTLSGYYPESIIEMSAVNEIEKEHSIQLLPEDFDQTQATQIDGKTVIPFDKINFGKVSNPELKSQVRAELEQKQLENPKVILGYKISNLYDFFLLFVFMAGIASLVLFLLSKRLIKMMHNVE